MTPTQIFALVARAQFRPFNQFDWDCFAGCDSENPLFASLPEADLVLDGDVLQVFAEGGSVWQVSLQIEEI